MPKQAYEFISTQTLGSDTSTVTFSSIPQNYTDLVLIIDGTITSAEGGLVGRVGNGSIDTGTNYSTTFVFAGVDQLYSQRESSAARMIIGRASSSTASSSSIINYLNYSNTTTWKTVLARGNSSSYTIEQVATWRSTAAIDTLNVFPDSSRVFATGTVFTLYGIKAA
jgi:hypothetical protein